jgi:uncharacterized membrane protein
MVIERSIDIAAAPQSVWEIIRDVERWAEWTASISSIERLESGPFGVGSRARVRQPRLPAAVWTVSALEEGRFFDWRSDTPLLTSVGRHRVEPTADGKSRATLSIEWSGPLAPVIRLFYGTLSERYVEMEAQGLKRRSEALQASGSQSVGALTS